MSQIDFPFVCDDAKLKEFLASWLALEIQEDAIREEKRLLKEEYQDHFPLRAVLVAVKVVRAKDKLEQHPKEPMSREYQSVLEHTVEGYLMDLEEDMSVRIVPLKTPRPSRKRLGFALVAEKEEASRGV